MLRQTFQTISAPSKRNEAHPAHRVKCASVFFIFRAQEDEQEQVTIQLRTNAVRSWRYSRRGTVVGITVEWLFASRGSTPKLPAVQVAEQTFQGVHDLRAQSSSLPSSSYGNDYRRRIHYFVNGKNNAEISSRVDVPVRAGTYYQWGRQIAPFTLPRLYLNLILLIMDFTSNLLQFTRGMQMMSWPEWNHIGRSFSIFKRLIFSQNILFTSV